MGAGPDVPVAVCLERSERMLVAMLAILRSGSYYVPLDPDYPADRIAYMLEDSRAQMLVTETAIVNELPTESVQVICSDEPLPGVDHIELPEGHSSDLAYQIYTSGSTGLPKGVQITQRNIVNFLNGMADTPGLSSEDRLLAITTLCFDISLLELFLPLTVGATVVIASQTDTADGFALKTLLDTHDITLMQATPATWRLLLQAGWQGKPNLRVLCGGEALERDLAESLATRAAELWNMYGPTETTVWSACHRYSAEDSFISVGTPVANNRLYVLDAALQVVPQGVPGELWIGGDGVARGYWQRDELNAERFVADPYSDSRMYRTGDRARWHANGQLEILGRTDYQVKLRGFRIELGEIEAALAAIGDVTQAIVLLREDQPRRQTAGCLPAVARRCAG